MARIEKQDNKDKIIVSKLRKTRENKEDKQFKNRVKALMPKIDLPDLLLEVNQQLDLTSCFHHINESNTRMDHCQQQIKKLFLHTKNFLFLLYGEIIKWLRPTVFVIPHHNVPYILEVIQNILAAVVESHFTTLFLINILAFMEWLFQEHCVILCTYWMVF